jgi:hypothetical protein
LVRDPDPGQVLPTDAGVRQGLRRDVARDVPDLGRVVLDPARPRKVLLELAVGAPAGTALFVEDDAGRSRGPLVNREYHVLGFSLLLVSEKCKTGTTGSGTTEEEPRMIGILIAVVVAALVYMICVALGLPAIVGIIAAILVLLAGIPSAGFGFGRRY